MHWAREVLVSKAQLSLSFFAGGTVGGMDQERSIAYPLLCRQIEPLLGTVQALMGPS